MKLCVSFGLSVHVESVITTCCKGQMKGQVVTVMSDTHLMRSPCKSTVLLCAVLLHLMQLMHGVYTQVDIL